MLFGRCFCLVAAVLGTLITAQAHAVEYKVVLLGGQSNMDGRGNKSGLPTALQAAQTNVRYYTSNVATTGFSPASTWTDLKPGTLFGPEMTFGKAISAADPTASYALLKYAVGGTDLATDWKAPTATSPSTGATYSAFKSSVSTGLSALSTGGNTYKIVAMLWLQGESDSGTASTQYATNLTNLIADVRTTYGANLPFVIGGIGYQDATSSVVSAAQASVAAADPLTAYFNNDDVRPTPTALHFDAAGQQVIGQRYATALQSIPEPGSLGLAGIASALSLLRRRRAR